MILFVDSSNNSFVHGKYIWYPPYERRFIMNPLCNCKLSHLYGIRLLQVCKSMPGSHAIFPFCTELQSLHCLLILSIVFMKIDIHVIMCDNSIVIFSPMISLSSKYWFQIQHQPHWVYIFTAMTFTEYSATCLSRNSTSYIQVSRIRLGCSIPLREPSCSLFQGDNRWGVDACRIVHDFQYQHGTTCLFRKMSINGWQTGWNLLSIPSDTESCRICTKASSLKRVMMRGWQHHHQRSAQWDIWRNWFLGEIQVTQNFWPKNSHDPSTNGCHWHLQCMDISADEAIIMCFLSNVSSNNGCQWTG
jgi:hypothetical protein